MKIRTKVVAALALGTAFSLAVGVASQAATATWYNASSSSWTNYSEPTTSSNVIYRTGQYFRSPGTAAESGLVYTKLWFGANASDGWDNSQSIGGANTIGPAGRGKFTWHLGGTVATDTGSSLAQATGAALNKSLISVETKSIFSAEDLAALASPAEHFGVSVNDFSIVATDGGTRLLTASIDDESVFTVLTSNSIAFSTAIATSDLSKRAAAIHIVQNDTGLNAQYVFTDVQHDADAAKVEGLEQIAPGVFADRHIATRTVSDEATTKALKTASKSTYAIPLVAGS